jgi:hypothetical protein
MKHYILFLFVNFICLTAMAQTAIPNRIRAENTIDRLSDKGGLSSSDLLYGIPIPVGDIIGDNYLDKKWNKSTVILYESEKLLEGYWIKYDIKNGVIEFKTKGGIKIIGESKIKNIIWIDSLTSQPHYFVNGGEYKIDGVPSSGLYEVMVDGEFPLLKKSEIHVIKPTYIPAFDVGTRDTKISLKDIFLYAKEGELTKIKNKADVVSASGSRAAEMESFIKVNKLNVNKPLGLVRAFEFINKK